jgi:hypothetical protein
VEREERERRIREEERRVVLNINMVWRCVGGRSVGEIRSDMVTVEKYKKIALNN